MLVSIVICLLCRPIVRLLFVML